MRAAIIQRYDEPPVVGERPEPTPTDGLALVDVTAAPLNPVDLSIANRRYFMPSPPVPYVPGREGVGRIAQSKTFKPGTLVYFESDPANGALAKRALGVERPPSKCPPAFPIHWQPVSASPASPAGWPSSGEAGSKRVRPSSSWAPPAWWGVWPCKPRRFWARAA